MTRTVKVRGTVTAQKIQKFDDTTPLWGLGGTEGDSDIEKSNIDILNMDYVSSVLANSYKWRLLLGSVRTATSVAGRKMIPRTAIVAIDELSNFAALAIPTFILLSFCATTEYICLDLANFAFHACANAYHRDKCLCSLLQTENLVALTAREILVIGHAFLQFLGYPLETRCSRCWENVLISTILHAMQNEIT